MRFGSLFSGIGGLDLGLERAGHECAWQVEIDDACDRVLARHWPDIPRYRDVRHVHDQRRTRCPNCLPAVDVLVGGFPCQDVSVAGRRVGLAGERSGLWFEFRRLAAQLRPRWVVIENVPGLLSSCGCPECRPSAEATEEEREDDDAVARWTRPDHRGRDFAVIVQGLVELGYGVAWRVLDAQYFGVAQRRRRVFVVGCLGDPARAAQILLESESCSGNPAPRRSTGTRVGALSSTGIGVGGPDDNQAQAGHLVKALLGHHPRAAHDEHFAVVTHALRAEGADASEDGTGRGTPLVAISANQRGEVRERPVHGSLNGSQSAKQYDGVMAGMSVRRLTPTECERLQGFPDGWTEGLSDSARYRCLGNAVCVPVVEWICRRLVEQAA